MEKTKEHVKEHGVVYSLIVAALGAGGIATVTDSVPVTQGEYRKHLEGYNETAGELEDIQGSLDQLLLQQLRQSLRQAYKDRCFAEDPQAIRYINSEIDDLQDAYVGITGRRFEPPPCEDQL